MAENDDTTIQECAITPNPIDREAMKALVLSAIKKGVKSQAGAIDGLCRLIENAIQERALEAAGHMKPEPLEFCAEGLYTLMPGADAKRIKEQLIMKLCHLSAMLEAIYGGGFESFCELPNEHMDSYLWACASTAAECKELAGIV